jgi:[ribosomal protein S5]-alanine N-acetyltransferase
MARIVMAGAANCGGDDPGMRALPCGELMLEPQTVAHARTLFQLLSDARLYAFEGEPPKSLAWWTDRLDRLSSRRSPDGREAWLNWVVCRYGEPLGYVQATVFEGLDARRTAWVAYVLGADHWRQGLATRAVACMEQELVAAHGVQRLAAVFKRANLRSAQLLARLGYGAVPEADALWQVAGPEERVLARSVSGPG